MIGRSRHFMEQTADIQRPNIIIDASNIRDRRISEWGTVKSSVPCYVEPAGTDMVPNAQLGRTVVERFTVYFQGDEPVQNNDRLLISGTYYTVEGTQDFSDFRSGWHMYASVRKMGKAQS
jgi:hypothetical protein